MREEEEIKTFFSAQLPKFAFLKDATRRKKYVNGCRSKNKTLFLLLFARCDTAANSVPKNIPERVEMNVREGVKIEGADFSRKRFALPILIR